MSELDESDLIACADDEWELHYGPLLIGYMLIRQGGPRLERIA